MYVKINTSVKLNKWFPAVGNKGYDFSYCMLQKPSDIKCITAQENVFSVKENSIITVLVNFYAYLTQK